MSKIKRLHILIGPLLGVLVAYCLWFFTEGLHPLTESVSGIVGEPSYGNLLIPKMAGIAVWIAYWWITEAISIYVTALLPLCLFPLFGVMGMNEVAPNYTNQIIFLFVGGFMIAFAMERWNLHRRIALKIILLIGTTPSRLLFGFMFASYFLSMWILNTSTVMMLLPAVIAVIDQLAKMDNNKSDYATPLLLGLAYAASIGGTASLIGTAPNLFMAEFVNEKLGVDTITFANWFLFGFPISIVMFFLTYLVIKRIYLKRGVKALMDSNYCKEQYEALGKRTAEENRVLFVFGITILLWFFRSPIEIGDFRIPGWTELGSSIDFFNKVYIKDSTIAIMMGLVLFLIPSKKEKGALLRWEDVKKMPLGVLFLFGGGFALAAGVQSSGLSEWLAKSLSFIQGYNPVVIIFGLALFMTFFTELTSNTASTILILPIIYEMSKYMDIHPVVFMLPVTLSASFAFMLPVATPPNTIIFGSERITIKSMMKTGLIINLIGALVCTLGVLTLGRFVFGV